MLDMFCRSFIHVLCIFFLVVLLLSFHMQLGSIYNCLSVTEIAVYTLLRILNV